MNENQCRISVFEEKDFLEASKMIIDLKKEVSERSFLFYPEQYDNDAFFNYYRAINMRTNHFHEVELYMNVIDINTSEKVGVLGIYIWPNNYVVYITTVILTDSTYLGEAVNQLNELLKSQSVKRLKVKFTNRKVENVAKWIDNGFEKETIIVEEGTDGSDFLIYSRKL